MIWRLLNRGLERIFSLLLRKPVFRNWGRNQVCTPHRRPKPRSTEAVAAIVARAAAEGRPVKALGRGHSFTDAACTSGILVSLRRMKRIEDIDLSTQRVTVQAGIRLKRLNRKLYSAGLALPNLGDIDKQSLAGAFATATHGTGIDLGNLATTIVAMDIVNGRGEVIHCDEHQRPDLLRVARVGVGALGIVTRVTLQCVPAFDLHATENVEVVEELLDNFEHHISTNDHFEILWMPGARRALVKRNNRTDKLRRRQPLLSRFVLNFIFANVVFGLANSMASRVTPLTRAMSMLIRGGGLRPDVVDSSHRVFVSMRRVRFVEMEYAVPLQALPEVVRRVGEYAAALSPPAMFPIEVRTSAADDIALSTAYGRDTGWIACHVYSKMPFSAYFRAVEAIASEYDGRPHWGKLHFQDHRSLSQLYPEWETFQRVRSELDPDGTFRNLYTDTVLGPVVAVPGAEQPQQDAVRVEEVEVEEAAVEEVEVDEIKEVESDG